MLGQALQKFFENDFPEKNNFSPLTEEEIYGPLKNSPTRKLTTSIEHLQSRQSINRLVRALMDDRCQSAPALDYRLLAENQENMAALYATLKEEYFRLDNHHRAKIRQKISDWRLAGSHDPARSEDFFTDLKSPEKNQASNEYRSLDPTSRQQISRIRHEISLFQEQKEKRRKRLNKMHRKKAHRDHWR